MLVLTTHPNTCTLIYILLTFYIAFNTSSVVLTLCSYVADVIHSSCICVLQVMLRHSCNGFPLRHNALPRCARHPFIHRRVYYTPPTQWIRPSTAKDASREVPQVQPSLFMLTIEFHCDACCTFVVIPPFLTMYIYIYTQRGIYISHFAECR